MSQNPLEMLIAQMTTEDGVALMTLLAREFKIATVLVYQQSPDGSVSGVGDEDAHPQAIARITSCGFPQEVSEQIAAVISGGNAINAGSTSNPLDGTYEESQALLRAAASGAPSPAPAKKYSSWGMVSKKAN